MRYDYGNRPEAKDRSGNRRPPRRSNPFAPRLRQSTIQILREKATHFERGHEEVLDGINTSPGPSISRATYFNALRGEPISERTYSALMSYLDKNPPTPYDQLSREDQLRIMGIPEDKVAYWAKLMDAALSVE